MGGVQAHESGAPMHDDSDRPARKWFALAFVVLLAVAAGWLLVSESVSMTSAGACTQQDYDRARSAPSVSVDASVGQATRTLEITDITQTQISLGRGPGPARTAIILRTDQMSSLPSDPAVQLRVVQFRRGINPSLTQAVQAYGEFTSSQVVTVFLCIEREHLTYDVPWMPPYKLDPGTYSGAVTITDPRLPATSIPVQLNLSYTNSYRLALILVGTVLVGSAYLMVLRRGDGNQEFGVSDFDSFLRTPSAIAAVIAGTASATTAFSTVYIASDTWGSSLGEFLSLTATTFTAFVAAGTAFRFAANLSTSKPLGRAQPAGHREEESN